MKARRFACGAGAEDSRVRRPRAPASAFLALVCVLMFPGLGLGACGMGGSSQNAAPPKAEAPLDPRLDRSYKALSRLAARGPEWASAVGEAREAIQARPREFLGLLSAVEAARQADPELFRLVNRIAAPLSPEYEPRDLVALDGSGLSVSRPGHRLREPAVRALKELDRAARGQGLILLVSSSFRSFEYQKTALARAIASDGEAEGRKVVAEPGRSQHQLGTAVDFGSIDNGFAETAAGRWLAQEAGRYGFSLSYPRGREALTEYSWESWHYRYIGVDACRLETEFFGSLQEALLSFLSLYGEGG